MIDNIIKIDEIVTDRKILSQTSKETTLEEIEQLDLKNRLINSSAKAWTKGCGLAAIQIGIPLRFAWFLYKDIEYTLLNPEIIYSIGKYTVGKEGCLSIPDNWVSIERFFEIKYLSNGKEYKAKGLKAQIIQHEIDHMNGILNS